MDAQPKGPESHHSVGKLPASTICAI